MSHIRGSQFLQKYSWYSYLNKRRHENKLVKSIKDNFGSDVVIVIGDWSSKYNLRYTISTPNTGLKRVLNSHFETP